MKTRTAIVISLTAIITLVSGSAFGAYSGGSGTAGAPYQIATKADLLTLAATTADYGKYFILTADINMGGQVFTTAIIAADTNPDAAFQGTAFNGIFDGNDYKITHFTINGGNNSFLGLFGYINSGSVKNLGIENCSVSGSYDIGGLAGYNSGGNISDCYSTATVSGSGDVGGLVGFIINGNVTDCYSTGAISGSSYVGGLVGWNYGNISNCYSMGTVNGSSYVGGLLGFIYSGNVTNCYSTGIVSGSSDVGGMLGLNFNGSGSIVGSFWDINTSGQTTSAGGTGRTTAQMKTLSTFTSADWDFTTIWAICNGTNYPRLIWQIPAGDLVCPDGVNFADFSYFAQRWKTSGCNSSNNFCNGADIDSSGTADMLDLDIFAATWLSGE